MITLIKLHFEKLLLLLASVALLLSAGWSWRRPIVVSQSFSTRARPSEGHQPAPSAARLPAGDWSTPVAQAAGPDWVFEIFSPPVIQHDAGTGKFTAGMPRMTAARRAEPGIRLLAIRAAPYRVQLQGGFGAAGEYVAALVALATHEVWCARPGERWAAMDVTLAKVDAGGAASARADQASEPGYLARAVVRDGKTGREVTLVAGVTSLTHELLATVQLANNSKPQNLREGETCGDGECAYRVERLSLNPIAVAVVTKKEPGRERDETLLLRPDAPDVGDAETDERAELSSHPHSFHNGP